MAQRELDGIREERIDNEVVVDAYGEEEKALGWYYYLEDKCAFPFLARCLTERAISPLLPGDEVEVVRMAPLEESAREMFVSIRWKPRRLAVPLSQLDAVASDEETMEAVEDWRYWVERGYHF